MENIYESFLSVCRQKALYIRIPVWICPNIFSLLIVTYIHCVSEGSQPRDALSFTFRRCFVYIISYFMYAFKELTVKSPTLLNKLNLLNKYFTHSWSPTPIYMMDLCPFSKVSITFNLISKICIHKKEA